MAKSFFQATFGFVSNIFSFRSTHEYSGRGSPNASSQPNTKIESRKRKAVDSDDDDDNDHDFTPSSKRRRLFKNRPDYIPYADERSSPFSPSGLPRQSTTVQSKAERDRTLMPPPATPALKNNARDDDAISFAPSTMAARKTQDMDEEQMEAARRHAAAITLPENSGTWSDTEQDLYFHLAYRGFEPLLPQNWMIDFDTLPLSIFAHEDSVDPPLVQNQRDNQFRAAHALRNLLEAGHDVRDRTHVSPGVRREKILGRITKRYLHWALQDVGLRPNSFTNFLPTHIVVTHRKGRSTLQTLEEMATKLHELANRHQKAAMIYPSIESHPPQFSQSNNFNGVKDADSIPTLIGLVIVSSVLTVITLSPVVNQDSTALHAVAQTASPPISESGPLEGVDPDRLRTIIQFDFSQSSQDVWNALGFAIVAMQIRKEALKVNSGDMMNDVWENGSFVTSRYGDDDLESRLGDVDDPDL